MSRSIKWRYQCAAAKTGFLPWRLVYGAPCIRYVGLAHLQLFSASNLPIELTWQTVTTARMESIMGGMK
jgi:hypothetical protein